MSRAASRRRPAEVPDQVPRAERALRAIRLLLDLPESVVSWPAVFGLIGTQVARGLGELPDQVVDLADRKGSRMPVRPGDWMLTFSGVRFWLMDPRPEEVRILDIAHALGNLCRYAGHTSAFYSVAQHSVLVSRELERRAPDDLELQFWGLLHDASEAYVTDVPRPLKPYLANYASIEADVLQAIAARFSLHWPPPAAVKEVDQAVVLDEMSQLFLPPGGMQIAERMLRDGRRPLGVAIEPLPPTEAEEEFLVRAGEIIEGGWAVSLDPNWTGRDNLPKNLFTRREET